MSDTAQEIADALENPARAPQMVQAGDAGPSFARGKTEVKPFPRGCPIEPLGNSADLNGSQRCYYLDGLGQILSLEAGNRHGKNALIHMFGENLWWLEENFPMWSKPIFEGRGADRRCVREAEVIGFDQAEASQALIIECYRRGIFDPSGRMRGRGAHNLAGGGLVLHYGDRLLAVRPKAKGGLHEPDWHETGLHEKFVYPAAAAIPQPWHVSVAPKATHTIRKLLMTWNWKRPILDVRLMLGAIGQGYIGGALPWRSNLWITGGRGTGKSTLNGENGVVPSLYGDGLFRTGNASAAAIRQSLKNSTVPVLFDEIEAGADNRRVQEVIELARVSSSGDKIHRGGQDHQAHEFTLRSPFWFSSIIIPPLMPQDRSRLAILELRPFAQGSPAPALADFDFSELGRQLQRRMIDGWPMLAKAKDLFHAALARKGHDARACDQFATLLACAHLLEEDALPDEDETQFWADQCAPDRMAEVSEAVADEEACMNHLMTSMVQARGGDERESLGTWVGRAVQRALTPDTSVDERTADRLEQIGLKLVSPEWKPGADGKTGRWGAPRFMPMAGPGFLAVANSHQALDVIFTGTRWQGGAWKQSLSRTPGAIDVQAAKFGRISARCVLVPLCAVLDDSELAEISMSKADAVRAWRDNIEKGVAV